MPTGEVVRTTRKLIEKADGLCYDAQNYAANPKAKPIWTPALCDFTSTGSEYLVSTGRAKVNIKNSLADDYPIHYTIASVRREGEITDTADHTLSLGVEGIGYFDRETNLFYLLECPKAVVPQATGNRIVFAGAFSGCDLEYVYDRASFKQNLIIRDLSALPAPEKFGLTPKTTLLAVASRMKMADFCAGKHALEALVSDNGSAPTKLLDSAQGSALEVTFRDSRTKTELCSFAPGVARAEGTVAERDIHKHIAPQADGTALLYEGVAYDWLLENASHSPLVLDYQIRTGTSQGSEAWQSGATYFVSGPFTVPSGATLVIEGGAIVKINGAQYGSEPRIQVASGAKLRVMGTKFNYALVIPATNADVGEPISNPVNTYFYGFRFTSSASSATAGSEINYCKFSGLKDSAIKFEGSAGLSGTHIRIKNCVFRAVERGIRFCGTSVGTYVDIANCLFYDCDLHGIWIWVSGSSNEVRACIWNCTFDWIGSKAIRYERLAQPPPYPNLVTEIRDCVFTRCGENAVYGSGASQGSGIWNCGHAVIYDEPYICDAPRYNCIELDWPVYCDRFVSPNGGFYSGYYGGGCSWQTQNKGSRSASVAGLDDKTIIRPAHLTPSNINGGMECTILTDPEQFTFNDTGDVDIGYHYDIVRGVIDGGPVLTLELTTELHIPRGAVLSYTSSVRSLLEVTGEYQGPHGKLKAVGTEQEPILFTTIAATGDAIQHPLYQGCQIFALMFQETADPNSEVRFCRFDYFYTAAHFYTRLNNPLESCVFYRNSLGVQAHRADIDVLNNLFIANDMGIYLHSGYELHFPNIEGNTFYGNDRAVQLAQDWSGNCTLFNMVVEDNIFACNQTAAVATFYPFHPDTLNDVTRNNLFWNNGLNTAQHVQNSALVPDPDTTLYTAAPLFVHKSRSENGDSVMRYEHPDPPGRTWSLPVDGFFLAQQDGDASRRPLYLLQSQHLAEEGGMTLHGISAGDEILVFCACSERIPTDAEIFDPYGLPADYRGFVSWYSSENWSYSRGNQPESGPLWLAINSRMAAGLDIEENAHVDLTLENGSQLSIYLPEQHIPERECATLLFWVAEDGSTYFANTSKAPTQEHHCNMDAYYASRWADDNLAKSARTARGSDSPAVDYGSRDFLNIGYTKTVDPQLTNLADSNRDNPDDPTTPYKDESLNLDLDLGYHYYGLLRHPREEVPSFEGELERNLWQTGDPARPKIKKGWEFTLVATSMAEESLENMTMAIYSCGIIGIRFGPFTNHAAVLLYHMFRTDPPVTGCIRYFIQQDNVPVQGIWAVESAALSSGYEKAGTVYVSCAVNFQLTPTPTPGSPTPTPESPTPTPQETAVPYVAKVCVYRYDPTNGTFAGPGLWTEIACFSESGTRDYTSQGTYVDTALAPTDNDLYVFWTRQFWGLGESNKSAAIYGARIHDATTRDVSMTSPIKRLLSLNDSAGSGWDSYGGSDWNFVIDADWDYILNRPRIVYVKPSGGIGTKRQVRGARVQLDGSGELIEDGLDEDQPIAEDDEYEFGFPSLAVNRDLFTLSGAYRAFTCFMKGWGEDNAKSDLLADEFSDSYTSPEPILTPINYIYSQMPDVTFRAFGTPRYSAGRYDNTFVTNTEMVFIDPISEHRYAQSKIATNSINSTDIFAVARFYTYDPTNGIDMDVLNIFQIDP